MGWLGNTVSLIVAGHQGEQIGQELADRGGTVPDNDDSMLRLAERCGVNIQYEEELDQFTESMNESWAERMLENGQDEADKGKKRGWFW